MTHKNTAWGKTALKWIMVVPSIMGVINHFCNLVEWEARLARRSLIKIALLAFVTAILFSSVWLCLLGMFFFYLISLPMSPTLALFFIFLFNILLLIIVILLMSRYKSYLFFPETSRMIR